MMEIRGLLGVHIAACCRRLANGADQSLIRANGGREGGVVDDWADVGALSTIRVDIR